MEKVMAFLKENPVFHFATLEGDEPRVRPLGFSMNFEGKLYLGIGKQKPSYRQITANPKIEFCSTGQDGRWMRVKGKVVMDDRPEVLDAAFAVMPNLKSMYNETTGAKLGLFYIADATAEFADMQGGYEKISF